MTRDELVRMLSERVGEDFAGEMARRVVAADAVATLYAVATDSAAALPRPLRERVAFRSAYVLERLYFRWPECFMPHAERFCARDFAVASGMGVRRCFSKVMADLLRRFRPSDEAAERIAGAAAEWLADPSAPVAVKVRAFEVLERCRDRVAWVDGAWSDLLDLFARNATPGITCRLRRLQEKNC